MKYPKISPILKPLLKGAVAFSIILWLVWQLDFSRLAEVLSQGRLDMLAWGSLTFFFCWVFAEGLRFHTLIADYMDGPFASVRVLVESHFFNTFLPANLGGDGYKIHYLAKQRGVGLEKSFVLVFLERVIGLLVILGAGTLYLVFYSSRIHFALFRPNLFKLDFFTLTILAAGLVLLVLIFLWPAAVKRLREVCKRLVYALKEVSLSKLGLLFALTLFFHFLQILSLFYFVLWVQESVFFFDLILVMALTSLASVLPISIGTVGIREGAMVLTLTAFGLNQTDAVLISFLERFLLLLIAAAGGSLFALGKIKKP